MKPTLESQLAEVDTGVYELTVTITTDISKWISLPARLKADDWEEARIQANDQMASLRTAFGLDDKPKPTCTGCARPAEAGRPLATYYGQPWHKSCYYTLEV